MATAWRFIAMPGVRIITRGGHDWTHRFPAIAAQAAELDAASFILDGEAVVLDEAGRGDFERAMLFAFDLLYLDGHDLTRMALSERRHMLEDLIDGESGTMRLSEEVEADGAEFLASACKFGLEASSPNGATLPIDPAAAVTGSRSNASSPTPS